ncbi:P-loop containing nucleoside triphosphate hydrolase protein [Mycena capillaripes]|nr:P-loop containing nucleoside triphosphate hydrolase protein [Mycena capillaripes]
MSVLITNDGLILSLAPSKPYSLTIKNLTIGGSPSREKHSSVNTFNVPVLPAFIRPKTKAEGAATIVRAVSGTCGAGEMLAIIGASGSGKTTLLNAIAGRLQGLPILEGKISFQPATQSGQNAVKDGAPKVSDIIGFVGQNDYLLPHLTVKETLTFSAALRLPKAVDNNTVRHIVNQTIEELGLKECADIVVGGIFRKGISGGEHRRLSIGCVQVTMPSVLILDEATIGLDATTSFLLLQTLLDLAKRHSRTIILSLHAPRSDAFVLFDRLIVRSKGDVMYSGRASDSLGWFEEHGCKLKKETNPLDFLVDVTSVDNRSSDREDESRVRVTILVQAWKDREHEKDIPPPLTGPVAHNISRDSQGGDLDEDASNIARPGPIKQTRILLHRSHLNVYRNYEQLAGFLIQSIGIGVFMGLTYFDLQGTPAGIQSLKGAAIQLFPGYFYLTQVYWIYKFCSDLIIFDREREDRLYSTFPYIIADFISNLVPTTLLPTL